jgi:signal transduction histidine kinase
MICYWYSEPLYFFYAPDNPELLYYSHLTSVFLALIVGSFVFLNGRHRLENKLLFAISLCYSAWIFINLFMWTHIHSDTLLFMWSFYGILQGLISIFSIYFIYAFIYKKDVTFTVKLVFLALLAPIFVFAPSNLHLSGFNLAWCDAFQFEGEIYKNYYTFLGLVAMGWILTLLVKGYKIADSALKKQLILMGVGIELFLFSFFTILFIATELAEMGVYSDSRLEYYGLFGMTIFMVMMGILIVRFKSFSVALLAPEALTFALLALVASQYTYVDTKTGVVLTSITLALTALAGTILIRSVRKEVAQRKELEILTGKLEKANKRLKVLDKLKSEFVSIASHQLRSPLTSIRGYASMLLEGSYGKLNADVQDAIERIAESSRMMALSVEDYLNVSRIQAGNMKYEYSDFNLPDTVSHIVDDIRRDAIKKGLVLSFKSDLSAKGVVHADKGKTMQILHNLINNSIKYTPKGTITVFAHDSKKLIQIDVVDTGIGMSPETIETVFGKFERAKNANEVNVTGTGLGLYVAQKMAREMGGDIQAFSDGEGKGSTFRFTLPLQM